MRARSADELHRRLKQKGFAPGAIAKSIADFQEKGYQSDEDFARQLANAKWHNSGWGPARIRQELRYKGVDSAIVEQTIQDTFGDADLVLSIMPLARKKWRASKHLPREKRRQRLIGYLQRRGYDWSTISRVESRLDDS